VLAHYLAFLFGEPNSAAQVSAKQRPGNVTRNVSERLLGAVGRKDRVFSAILDHQPFAHFVTVVVTPLRVLAHLVVLEIRVAPNCPTLSGAA